MNLEEHELMREYGFEEVPVFHKDLKSGLSMMVIEIDDGEYHVDVRKENGDPFIDYTVMDLKELSQFSDSIKYGKDS